MNIAIFEIKKPIGINSNQIKKFADDYARYYQEFSDSWLIITPEKIIWDNTANFLLDSERFNIGFERLNKFAMNRLISNLEEKYPEMSLIMMSADEESKLFKIRKKVEK